MTTAIMQNGPLKIVQSFAKPGNTPSAFVLPRGSYILQMTGDGDDAANFPPTLSLYQGGTSGTLLGTLNTIVGANVPVAFQGVLPFQTDGSTLTISIAAGANGALPGEVTVWSN
jgi:hypothetical protein